MRLLKEWLQTNWRLAVGGGVVLVILLFQWLSRPAQATPQEMMESETSSVVSSRSSSSNNGNGVGYVHIQGAVVKPGLYRVTGQTRWAEIVTMAGGFTKDADSSTLNLAKIAQDQESLYVPIKGERAPATTGGGGAVGATGEKAQVNINTATAEELQTLSGIGPARAADIIAYREENGPFETIEGLKQVSGIGDKTFAKLEDSITVGP